MSEATPLSGSQQPDPAAAPALPTPAPAVGPVDGQAQGEGEQVSRRWDWSWRHGPVAGPVNAGGGLVAATMVADLASVSPWWGAAAGAAAAAGVGVRAASREVSRLGLTYRVGCWLGAGGWMSWALATSAWAPDVLAAAVAGTLAAGLAAPEMAGHESRVRGRRRQAEAAASEAQAKAAAAAARVAIATDWESRLARVARVNGALVEAVQSWQSGAGYSMQVRLPQGGTTWKQLAGFADALAADADLPHGCGIEVAPGKTRAVVVIRVATIDTTATSQPYPIHAGATSFTEALPLGMERHSRIADAVFLEDPCIVVGRQGSGKTTCLQTINAGVVRSTDALNWHIDLNGSGMSLPWLAPWLAGETDRPVLDWVAPTVEEAELMIETAIAMAEGRKVIYQERMAAVDDDKLPIGPDVPAIVITLDEGAEAMGVNRGNKTLIGLLDKLVSIARAARIRLIVSALRATADIIPPNVKAQAGVKIYVRPESEHEVAQLFGWGHSVEDVSRPGSGLLQRPSMPGLTPYMGFQLKPSTIRQLATICTPWRPLLDVPTARIGGAVYAHRWDRYRSWLASKTTVRGGTMPAAPLPGDDDPNATTGPAAGQPPVDPTNPTNPHRGKGMAGLASAAAEMEESLERLREVRKAAEARRNGEPGQPPANTSDDVHAAFAAIVGAEDWSSQNDGDGDQGDDATSGTASTGQGGEQSPQERMVAILRQAGPAGLHRDEVVARLKKVGIEPSRATVYRWLEAARDAGAIVPIGEAKESRWAATTGDGPDGTAPTGD